MIDAINNLSSSLLPFLHKSNLEIVSLSSLVTQDYNWFNTSDMHDCEIHSQLASYYNEYYQRNNSDYSFACILSCSQKRFVLATCT